MAQRAAKGGMPVGALRRKLDRALERRGRPVEIVHLLLHHPEGPIRRSEVWVEFNGFAASFQSPVEIARVVITVGRPAQEWRMSVRE